MLTRLWIVYPALVEAARAELSLDVLTGELRSLVADGVSIRNLRRILECLIEYEVITDGDPPDGRTAFVRRGLCEQIAHNVARETSTVVAYLLDPGIEAALEDVAVGETRGGAQVTPDDELYPKLRRIIIDEIRLLPQLALVPVILTQDSVRAVLSNMLKQEFPRLRVIAYGDLPPDFNVQPVARLTWN
jgi:type III secretion protein V